MGKLATLHRRQQRKRKEQRERIKPVLSFAPDGSWTPSAEDLASLGWYQIRDGEWESADGLASASGVKWVSAWPG